MTIFVSEHFNLGGGKGFPVLSPPIGAYQLSSGAGSTLNVNTQIVRVVSDLTAPVWVAISGSTAVLTSTNSLRLSTAASGGESYLNVPSATKNILQVQTST